VDRTTVAWIALAVVVLVFLDLLFVELRRAYREGKRIVNRLQGYADLPVVALASKAGDDAERLNTALDEFGPLLERADTALATIRTTLRDPFRRRTY
jgi:hypothetical protein